MFKNFFTLAIRNLLKRKVYSFINIFGLAIGVAVCLVILRYVDFELSYDSFHKEIGTLYRTTTSTYRAGEFRGTNVISGYAQGPALLADEPEVRRYIRTHPMYGGAVASYKPDNGDPITFREREMQFADSTFFHAFTYNAIEGNLSTALDKPNSVVITKKVAEKYFHDSDPLGKVFKISGGWADGDYEVTAVLKEVPQNGHFTFDFVFPIHNLLTREQYTRDNGWGWNNFVTYIQLQPHADVRKLEEKMPAFIDKYQGKELKESNSKNVLHFQPVRDIHLSPGLEYESAATVGVNTIYFLVLIAGFILAIAWVNYINLSTARAMERAREVGIKKAIGAVRGQLMSQFMFESVLVNLLGIIIAVVIAIALLPVLGQIAGKSFTFDFTDIRFWAVLFGLFAVGSVVSGAYPALMLSSFNTTEVLKGKSEKLSGGFSLRKALVVFQFTASLVLIAGTFAVYRQLEYMRSRDKGLTMDQMLIVSGPSIVDRTDVRQRLKTLKHEIQQIPGVTAVATSGAIPGGGHNWGTGVRRDGTQPEESKNGHIVWIDPDFINTYGIHLIAGKAFDPSIASSMRACLINEASLTAFGLGTPEKALTERLLLGGDTTEIIGVVKNYNWASLKTEIAPWIFKADTISGANFSVHLTTGNMQQAIGKIEASYKEAFPGNPFDYYFLDDFFNSQYKGDQQFGSIFGIFAVLAIVIACLGLWGLASFTTTQRLKEIGIRKVLGASVGGIMSRLSWQFLKLILIATLIALPLAWYGITTWLDSYAFKVGMQVDMFIIPVIILAAISLGTVSVQIARGANINPARILRTE